MSDAARKLQEVAEQTRNQLFAKNPYNNSSEANKYSAGHTRAKSDQKTPVAGKGTGTFLDTYNGGSDIDKNGNPDKAGSGRSANMGFNQFGKDNKYKHPDTSANEGQVRL